MEEAEAVKGSHFVQMCDQRSIPIVFLQNSSPEGVSVTTAEQGRDRFMSTGVQVCVVNPDTRLLSER